MTFQRPAAERMSVNEVLPEEQDGEVAVAKPPDLSLS